MFGNKLFLIFSAGGFVSWFPKLAWVAGEATRFVWTAEEEDRPINREWRLSIHWLWFYGSVCIDTEKEEMNVVSN